MKLSRLLGASLICVLCLVGVLQFSARAQDKASSASVTRSRTLANSGGTVSPTSRHGSSYYEPATAFVAPDMVAVEEFVNFHKHRLPLPKAGQSVALDVRWGNDMISAAQPEAVLQIGFTTPEVNDRTDLRPLNLALVIDKSGSMQAADKMSRVKDALLTMFGQLRENDIVSIVVFDTEARVLLPARRVGTGYELRRAVESIYPEGSTNLNAGLMLGYREAMKNYKTSATNRVILLTDGIANQGTTDPQQIAGNSVAYNREGIDLSTIGVGVELDQDLLRTLAKSGRGLFHFVAENEDIEKVFVREVQSLISPVAREVELTVDFGEGLELEKVYGYAPRQTAAGVRIPIDDMNNGLTQVVLMKFRAPKGFDFESAHPLVRLSYYDIKQKRMIKETQYAPLKRTHREDINALADVEVRKNYTIAELAQSLADMTAAAKRSEFRRAETFLNSAVSTAYNRYPNMEDKDIRYILNIVEDYQRNLRTHNRGRE